MVDAISGSGRAVRRKARLHAAFRPPRSPNGRSPDARAAGRDATVGASGHNARVTLARLSWLATVLVCVVSAFVSLLAGYQGYAAVLLVVGASAAINLR